MSRGRGWPGPVRDGRDHGVSPLSCGWLSSVLGLLCALWFSGLEQLVILEFQTYKRGMDPAVDFERLGSRGNASRMNRWFAFYSKYSS